MENVTRTSGSPRAQGGRKLPHWDGYFGPADLKERTGVIGNSMVTAWIQDSIEGALPRFSFGIVHRDGDESLLGHRIALFTSTHRTTKSSPRTPARHRLISESRGPLFGQKENAYDSNSPTKEINGGFSATRLLPNRTGSRYHRRWCKSPWFPCS